MIVAHRSVFWPAIGLLVLAGCKSESAPACPTCVDARLGNKWCDSCKVGYVAGVPIKSKLLFECLDAHGHDLDLKAVTCPTCRAALAKDGFCDECRRGWVRKQAYYSRLTFHLARGKPTDVSTIRCAACRRNAERYGWCDACKTGMIGNVAITDRAEFEDGCRGFDLMLLAIDTSKRCEACGMAAATDSMCPFCRITFKDGKPVKPAGA